MEQAAIVLLIIALLSWLYLLLFHRSFWRASERLDTQRPSLAEWPEVVAVIPARDEAASIANALHSHAASTYHGDYRIVVVDDHSQDGTGEIASNVARCSKRPVVVTCPPELEEDWTGKLWALQHGLDIAANCAPNARYVMFTDADIVHAPDLLARLVAKAETEELALISLMARLDSRGFLGSLLIPAFVFFFQKLYPFPAVNDPSSPMAAAAGGCILMRKDVLDHNNGLASISSELIDDCAIARMVKGLPPTRKLWLGLSSDEVISVRDNRPFRSVLTMVTRTAFTQLDYSTWRLVATIMAMAVLYLIGPLAILLSPLHQSWWIAVTGSAIWFATIVAYRPTLSLYGKHALFAFTLPLSACAYTLMTVISAIQHFRGQGSAWKGRSYVVQKRQNPGAIMVSQHNNSLKPYQKKPN